MPNTHSTVKPHHFLYREPVARLLGAASALVSGGYLVWRLGWTMNWHAWWLSVPLLVAEFHGYLTFLLFVVMVWHVRPRTAPRPAAGHTVDFYIPTYNEPYEVLAPTVIAAVGVRYPHRTWVLDDGKRPWVRELCERVGAGYVTREGNAGAKAGNVNAAMQVTSAEFIALVDADFVPAPGYIDDMLGYFDEDDRLALVQAPQEFYNVRSFQHDADDSGAWHEQRVFFKVIQVGKNRWNAAFWSGAPSMYRRSALEAIGGIPTDTVTEDLHTSLLLHRRRWNTVFHPNVVALGLAPDDYDGFIIQRQRWAEGAMQVIRREWRMRGLTLMQRLNYLGSTGTYFDAIRKVLMLAIVPTVLITDTLPVLAPPGLFLGVWAVHVALSIAGNKALGRGHYRYMLTELFDLLKMFAFIQATPRLLSTGELKFKVTPKGNAGQRHLHPLLAPFVVLVAIYALAVVVALIRLAGWGVHASMPAATVGALLWAALVIASLLVVLRRGVVHMSRRRTPRLLTRQPLSIVYGKRRATGVTSDVSMTGCSLSSAVALAPGTSVRLRFLDEGFEMVGTVRACRVVNGAYRAGVDYDYQCSDIDAYAALFGRTIFESSAAWIERIDGASVREERDEATVQPAAALAG